MPRRLATLSPLRGDQLSASSPRAHAALSASAGTGKTHVLTARVLRLLLLGVDPHSILCLTFTKAAAAEMAERIHERLARWVRMSDTDLGADLRALGEAVDPATRALARTLFAKVLDAPGGGLRIQTIHSFAQALLAAFPAEAGIAPGFRPMDEREQQLLARATLADLLVRAEEGGELGLIADTQQLSLRLGEGGAEAFLFDCARAAPALSALGAREGIEARLRRMLGVPAGDVEEAIAARCADAEFAVDAVRELARHNAAWATKAGGQRSSLCEHWLSASPVERASLLEKLHLVWATSAGERRSFGKGQAPQVDGYAIAAEAAFDCCCALLQMRRAAALARDLAGALRVGQAFAAAYDAAKRARGAADFDDLIRWAEQLLLTPRMGEWVRYKLDQSTDHVLVDEAQDTNDAQWNIVRALTFEFFAGQGAVQRGRTIFTVGDFKQAIFGFQGTDPRSFDVARRWFDQRAQEVRQHFLDLSMDRSFRSSPPVLEVVDRVIADAGPNALGLPDMPNLHESHHGTRPGSVVLWQTYDEAAAGDDVAAGEEGWVSDAVRRYAGKVARQIRLWLAEPFHVASKERPLRPEDILILVRKRGTLASLIVARLHAEGVPVAGVDRLLITAPLAVQDLLAAVRFAAQPMDDLNLAALLTSPLTGWSQEALDSVARGRRGALWRAVREQSDLGVEHLQAILNMADYASPYELLETILSGPIDGRRRLIERLGEEARDPIDELLASALEYEANETPSLQRFLDWFARGDVEIVRDPSAPLDAVRVMTVHGSKGLQSPVVILADACADPDRSRAGSLTVELEEGLKTPIFRPRKEELIEPILSQAEAQKRRDREEHWRLLYVALTRAEERLFIGGALGPGDRGKVPAASWYEAVRQAIENLGGAAVEDPEWGLSWLHGTAPVRSTTAQKVAVAQEVMLPSWVHQAAPQEARPTRPLTPSAPGDDETASPPPTAAMRAAAERGKLLHRLFERLPGVAPEERLDASKRWLNGSAGVANEGEANDISVDACRIVGHPALKELFGPGSLAEAPIAAVLPDGSVVAGTVDRLLVEPERVRLLDFKTGRAIPAIDADPPASHLRQMAAYVAALEVIFPGRAVEASLLYTAGPELRPLSRAQLAQHWPRAAGG